MIKTLLFLTALALSQGSEEILTVSDPDCPEDGHWLLPHEEDCTKFYYCEDGEKFIEARECAPGTEFSPYLQVCVHPSLAGCELSGATADSDGSTNAADATEGSTSDTDDDATLDSCEYLENGCPADFRHYLLPHETSCRKFYYCVNGEKVLSKCASGSVFNPTTMTCDHAGSIDRTCEDEDSSSEEEQGTEEDQSSEEIERLPNGCPVDWSISSYLAHEYYCNMYYQCIFGQLVERRCPNGTHFNTEIQTCDHIAAVGCTLAGGDASLSEEDTAEDGETVITPPSDLLDNGCPADGSITWMVPHEDCSKFYTCVWGSLVEFDCPGNLHFSEALQRCDTPAVAGCLCKDKECSSECSGTECSGEDDSPAGDDNEDLSSEEDIPAGDAPSAPASEEDNNDGYTTVTPPSDLLDNGCPVNESIDWLVPHEDCNKFYYCVGGNLVEMHCPAGLHFSPAHQRCDYPSIAGCADCSGDSCDGDEDRPAGDNDNDSSSEEDLPAGDAPSPPASDEENDDVTTVQPPSDLLDNGCPVNGSIHWLVPHEDCSKFYYCVWGELVESSCPSGLHFSPAYQRCEYPSIAGCADCNGDSCDVDEDTPADGNDNDSSSEEDLPAGDAPSPPASDEETDDVTTIQPPSDLLDNGCPVDGTIHWLVPHEDCSKFYYCVWGELVEASCPAGLHFSPSYQRCEYPSIAGCADCSGDSCDGDEDTPAAGNDNDSSSEEDLPAGDAPSPPASDEENDEENDDVTTIQPPSDLLDNGCPVNGSIHWLVPHEDCSKFFYCVWGELVEASCPAGLHFSPAYQRCEYPSIAGCADCSGDSCDVDEDTPANGNDNDSSSEDLPAGDATSPPASDEENDDVTTIQPPSDLLDNGCPVDGTIHWLVPHEDCSKFYYCVWGELVEVSCPGGLHFSPTLQRCDYPDVAGCIECSGDSCGDESDGNDTDGNDTNGNDPECDDETIDPNSKCEEECNVLPWAHEDCDKFWRCNGKEAVIVTCSEGLHFNPNTQTCDFICNAGCVRSHIQTTSYNDGVRVFLPWDQLDNETQDLLKLIVN